MKTTDKQIQKFLKDNASFTFTGSDEKGIFCHLVYRNGERDGAIAAVTLQFAGLTFEEARAISLMDKEEVRVFRTIAKIKAMKKEIESLENEIAL